MTKLYRWWVRHPPSPFPGAPVECQDSPCDKVIDFLAKVAGIIVLGWLVIGFGSVTHR